MRLLILLTCCVLSGHGAGIAAADPGLTETLSSIRMSLTPYAGDEFDGSDGSPPNPAMWNIETGGGGWGNGEQQTYTERNVRLDGQGRLVIEATDVAGEVTSARINTRGKAELAEGLIEASIWFPQGQGVHPAFWMLGTSLGSAGYPASGELDVIEIVNNAANAHFAVHGPFPGGGKWKLSQSATTVDLSTGFHTYWLYKQAGEIVVGINELAMARFDVQQLPTDAMWVQDAPFFALLNVAVGGEWPGSLGQDVLPRQMMVDWVRFYR